MKQINYEAEHRKLWNWLADHPGAEKHDYFRNWDPDSVPRNECFACEVACREADRTDTYRTCKCCPLGGGRIVGCNGGLYTEWATTTFRKRRQQLARIIATLSWKEKEND